MTTQEFNLSIDKMIEESLIILRVTKGKDYTATSEDRLSNFKEIAKKSGLEPLQIWQVWTAKHWDAINRAIIANPKLPTKKGESLHENFKDLVVYGMLGNAILEEIERDSANS
jgi:hypothetical protein